MDWKLARGVVVAIAVCTAAAAGCVRRNPYWDQAAGSGASSEGSGTADTTTGGESGGSSDNGESTGAPECGDGGDPIPGTLCHGLPDYVDIDDAHAVAAGDVTGDGHADVVVGADGHAWVLRGDGSGAFAAPLELPGIWEPRDAAIADLSQDGMNDFVIVGTSGDQTWAVYRSDGTGGHEDPDFYEPGSQLMGVVPADLDGDGNYGLYAADNPRHQVVALEHQSGGHYGDPWSVDVGTRPFDVASGDMDGDGDPDLATANYEDGTVSILRNNGEGGLVEMGDYPSDPGGNENPTAVAMADFGGDGNMDVVTAHEQSSEVVVMTGDGTGAIAIDQTYVVGEIPIDVALGDLDGDGRVDIVTADQEGRSLSVLLADGAGGFTERESFALDGKPRHVAVADFNRDGADDWIVTSSEAGWVAFAISEL